MEQLCKSLGQPPTRERRWLRQAVAAAFGLILGMTAPTARVAQASAPGGDDSTPSRLSLVEGEVSFWRYGAEDWVGARLNIPLAPGDHLYAGPRGRFEVQVDSEAFLRADAETEIRLDNAEPDYRQFRLTAGRVVLDVRDLDRGAVVEIDTPHAAFTVAERGYYRVEVGAEATRFVARRGGRATVSPEGAASTEMVASSTVIVEGGDTPRVAMYGVAEFDAWDRWNYERSRSLPSAESSRYVARAVYGLDSLDRYGSWRTVTTYGPVWVPRAVAPGWVPYSTGQWIYDPIYGWSWIDDEPWGWAPFHYGRWVRFDRYWGWAPGPLAAAPFYSPAMVGFLGWPGFSVGVGVAPVSWVALGWGEPLFPWWGPVGFYGAPCWNGWGGPRIVNRVVVHHEHVVHVDSVRYDHTQVPDAVVSVPGDRFGRSRIADVRMSTRNRNLRPLGGALPVAPTSSSLVPVSSGNGGDAIRPRRDILQRRVVATRAPRDPAERLNATGLKLPVEPDVPAPRLVSPVLRRGPRAVQPAGESTLGGGRPRPEQVGAPRRPRVPEDFGAPAPVERRLPPPRDADRPERVMPRRDDRPAVRRRFGDEDLPGGAAPRGLPRRPPQFDAPPRAPRAPAPADGSDLRGPRRSPLPERFANPAVPRSYPPQRFADGSDSARELPRRPPPVRVPQPPVDAPPAEARQRFRAPEIPRRAAAAAADSIHEREPRESRRVPRVVDAPPAPAATAELAGDDGAAGRATSPVGRFRAPVAERFRDVVAPPSAPAPSEGSDAGPVPARERRGIGPRRPGLQR